MKTILAPVDFSGASNDVVNTAIDLARVYNSQVAILHVVQPPVITSDFGVGLENVQELVTANEKTASANLKRLQAKLDRLGVPGDVTLQTGAAIPLILEHARKRRANFIVIGSHGHTALYDLLVGSTTQGILKSAPCPVMVLPRKKKAKKKSGKR